MEKKGRLLGDREKERKREGHRNVEETEGEREERRGQRDRGEETERDTQKVKETGKSGRRKEVRGSEGDTDIGQWFNLNLRKLLRKCENENFPFNTTYSGSVL